MTNPSRILVFLLALLCALSLSSCGGENENASDTTAADTTVADTTTEDTTTEDTTAEDTTAEDTTAEDTTAVDTTAEDTTAVDTTAVDTTAVDTTAVDTTAEDTTAEDTTAEDTTAEDTTAEDTTAEDTTAEDTTVADTTAVDTTVADTTVADTTANNDILGQGSKAQPYLEIPAIGDNCTTVTTISIPSGKAVFYDIYRVGGMIVTVRSSNVYVICKGTRYDAVDGVITFTAPDALASDALSFEIGNKGDTDASFTLEFTNDVGTRANPHKIDSVSTNSTVRLAKGDQDGYTYVYYAEKTGTVRFYVSADSDCILSVTNNRSYAQRTTDSDGQSDSNGTYVELDVEKGDNIIIIVGAIPDRRGNYPEITVTWSGKYN